MMWWLWLHLSCLKRAEAAFLQTSSLQDLYLTVVEAFAQWQQGHLWSDVLAVNVEYSKWSQFERRTWKNLKPQVFKHSFYFSFQLHSCTIFLDSLGGRCSPPKLQKHQFFLLFPLLKQKEPFLTHWSMIRCRHPPFKDKYRRPGRRHGNEMMEWLWRNTTKNYRHNREYWQVMRLCEFLYQWQLMALGSGGVDGLQWLCSLGGHRGGVLAKLCMPHRLGDTGHLLVRRWAMNIFEDGE